MSKGPRLAAKPPQRRPGARSPKGYRAITEGHERDEWVVVDARGGVVFRGDARVAALIASRLTRPAG